jgi:hypothetical protein
MLNEDEHRKGNKYTAKKSKTGGKNKVKERKKAIKQDGQNENKMKNKERK